MTVIADFVINVSSKTQDLTGLEGCHSPCVSKSEVRKRKDCPYTVLLPAKERSLILILTDSSSEASGMVSVIFFSF